MWSQPKAVTFAAGRKKWTVTVLVQRLADFDKSWHEPCNHCGIRTRAVLPYSFWCADTRTIYLREDRRQLDTFRIDFGHELDHAYVDFRGETFEQ